MIFRALKWPQIELSFMWNSQFGISVASNCDWWLSENKRKIDQKPEHLPHMDETKYISSS